MGLSCLNRTACLYAIETKIDDIEIRNGQLFVTLPEAEIFIIDLDNEKSQSQIDEIIAAGHARIFAPDTLSQAHREGYDNGDWCIGGGSR